MAERFFVQSRNTSTCPFLVVADKVVGHLFVHQPSWKTTEEYSQIFVLELIVYLYISLAESFLSVFKQEIISTHNPVQTVVGSK